MTLLLSAVTKIRLLISVRLQGEGSEGIPVCTWARVFITCFRYAFRYAFTLRLRLVTPLIRPRRFGSVFMDDVRRRRRRSVHWHCYSMKLGRYQLGWISSSRTDASEFQKWRQIREWHLLALGFNWMDEMTVMDLIESFWNILGLSRTDTNSTCGVNLMTFQCRIGKMKSLIQRKCSVRIKAVGDRSTILNQQMMFSDKSEWTNEPGKPRLFSII